MERTTNARLSDYFGEETLARIAHLTTDEAPVEETETPETGAFCAWTPDLSEATWRTHPEQKMAAYEAELDAIAATVIP